MKTKLKFGISVLLVAALLIGVAFIGSANSENALSESKDNNLTDELENSQVECIDIPNFGPETFENVKGKYKVLDTKGKIPRYSTQAERKEWLGTLHTTMTDMKVDIDPYLYPKGPVIYYGWDINGYLEVILFENQTLSKSQINDIYDVINRKAKQNGTSEIPVIFIADGFIQDTKDYDDSFNPFVGGIQIQAVKSGSTYAASLGFPVKKSNGNEGFVTAKHFADTVGLEIYQPTTNGNLVGTVTELAGHNADAAFIDVEDDSKVVPKIFLGSGGEAYVRGYKSQAPTQDWVGWRVYKTGQTTGVTGGNIAGIGVTLDSDGYKYYNQVKATYTSLPGDSGSPVYILDGGCKIVGITRSKSPDGTISYFSPLSGVINDLNVIPLTY
ncbi:hypothetical protein [Methanococcoides methylutens]|uniref:Uncharacterized protein n=1 Tax=Methanococcoides methylutens MM1 TaxID=1434104 RepID=A0A0E3SNJ8_METMT|nr:hypothetical protein [Methanococcoides methylutens]AKB84121.1 hypothetical protein MCMEM_0068 [Methanococcoides methylutens MM1]